jgi:ABC-type lipoprotein release transport system permease subunit
MTLPISLFVRLAWRNLWRHRRRNGLLLAAILVGVAAAVLTNALIRGYQYDMRDDAVNNLAGHLKVLAPGYLDDPSIEHAFELAPGWRPALPEERPFFWTARVRVPAVVMSERETRGVELLGVDPAAERGISFLGDVQIEGAPLAGPDDRGILLGRELLAELDTRVGRRVVVVTQGADGLNREAGYRVAGSFDATGTALEKAYAFTGRSGLQALLDTRSVTEVSIRYADEPADGSGRDVLATALPNLEVRDWRSMDPLAAAMFDLADTGLFIWLAIVLVALGFGLVNALATAVMERVREFGLVRALGMRQSHVLLQVLVESLLVVLLGVVAGILLGALLVALLADGVDLSAWAAGAELAGIRTVLVPRLLPGDLVTVLGFALVLGLLGSLYPAWRAIRIAPLDALRGVD